MRITRELIDKMEAFIGYDIDFSVRVLEDVKDHLLPSEHIGDIEIECISTDCKGVRLKFVEKDEPEILKLK